jgi:gluconate 2-dehydrogenase gamma chain
MGEKSNKENNDNSASSADANSTDTSRRSFLKYVAAGAVGVGIASAVEIPVLSNRATGENIDLQQVQTQLQDANNKISQLNSQIQSDTTEINSLNQELSSANDQIATQKGFLWLSSKEQAQVEAICETIIPSDGNGPGAKEAGVIFFIDRQLAGEYGYNGNMYNKGPFVMPNQQGPITVDGITYSGGSAPARVESGARYQYPMLLKFFWRYSLEALDSYSKSAYGDSFENLSDNDKLLVLSDIYNNVPSSFNNIIPNDFFYEIFFMCWAGYSMDPLYGGNKGKVAWEFTGFAAAANAENTQQARSLMVADKPTRIKSVSLAEYQKSIGEVI